LHYAINVSIITTSNHTTGEQNDHKYRISIKLRKRKKSKERAAIKKELLEKMMLTSNNQ